MIQETTTFTCTRCGSMNIVRKGKNKCGNPLPLLVETLLPAQAEDVLELDELWSFVGSKAQKCWLWIALCRRTRQVVSFFLGERDTSSCQQLWQRVPLEYSPCPLFSDAWQTYPEVLPPAEHHPVGKETGETAQVERWNNPLRQRLARYLRKTLSFSKSERFHYWMTLWFIIEHNQRWASLTL